MKRELQTQHQARSKDGSVWELIAFAFVFVVIFTFVARARADVSANENAPPLRLQPQSQSIGSPALPDANVAAGLPEPETNKRFGWTSKLTIDTSRSLNLDDATTYSGEYLLQTGFTDQKKNIAYTLKAGYDREYSQELKDGRDGDVINPAVSAVKTWKEGESYKSSFFDSIALGLAGDVGASHEAARRTYLGTIGPKLGIAKQIHSLHLGETLGYSRRFYNYDIRDDGTINAPNMFSSQTDVSYDLTPDLSISASTILFYTINFQNTGETTEWTFMSLDWSLTKLIAASVGVATKRGTVSDDGTYNQVKFFDGAVAQAFFDLVLNF